MTTHRNPVEQVLTRYPIQPRDRALIREVAVKMIRHYRLPDPKKWAVPMEDRMDTSMAKFIVLYKTGLEYQQRRAMAKAFDRLAHLCGNIAEDVVMIAK